MKSFDTNIQKYARKIQLKASERRELKERVLAFMEYHPLKESISSRPPTEKGILSEKYSIIHLHFNSRYIQVFSSVLILFVIVAPFAAEKSVPGDVLYLVKTGFNETIQAHLVKTPYEKIEFETKLMERRVGEARALADEGKLTDEVKAHIVETVKEHSEAVQQGIDEIRGQDVDGAAIAEIAFSSSLEVQSAILDGAGVASGAISDVGTILNAINDVRGDVAANQTATPSYEGLLASVETETTRTFELLEVVKLSATSEEIADIERRISDINRLTLEAQEVHVTDTEISAQNLAMTLGLINKLIVFMTDINVRATVSLEEIVPMVLSDIERADIVKEKMRAYTDLHAEITHRLEIATENIASEKVVDGLKQVDDLLRKIHTALGILDIDSAEEGTLLAQALIEDLDHMTQETIPEETPAIDEDLSVTNSTTTAPLVDEDGSALIEATSTKNE